MKHGVMININVSVKKCFVWNPSTCTRENSRYLKRTVDNWRTIWNQIINATESDSKILTNAMNTVSINVDNNKNQGIRGVVLFRKYFHC